MQSLAPPTLWTQFLQNTASAAIQFQERPGRASADFVKKYGMVIGGSILGFANLRLLGAPLLKDDVLSTAMDSLANTDVTHAWHVVSDSYQAMWDKGEYTVARNMVAGGSQLIANIHHLTGRRNKAYNFSTIGGTAHTVASAMGGLPLNFVTWGIFAQSSYQHSHWPKVVHKMSTKAHENFPRAAGFIHDNFEHAKELLPNFKNIGKAITQFAPVRAIGKKLTLLRDPHARAGTIGFTSNILQWVEAAIKKDPAVLNVAPWWTLGASFYSANGLITAHDKRKEAATPL